MANLDADALLLVGHGTRNEVGQQQFLALAEHLRRAVAPLPVEVAYIELQSPSLAAALASLSERGLKSIVLSPALLFAAGHAKRDVPEAVATALQQCPDLCVKIAEPLGCHEAVLELAATRFRVANDGDPAETALVVVGRGSSDVEAIAHCQQFAQLLGERAGVCHVSTGFIAIAQPSLADALEQAALSGAQQIVVQPHLLFAGEMQATTSSAVQAARAIHQRMSWSLADVLGSDLANVESVAAKWLVQALCERAAAI